MQGAQLAAHCQLAGVAQLALEMAAELAAEFAAQLPLVPSPLVPCCATTLSWLFLSPIAQFAINSF